MSCQNIKSKKKPVCEEIKKPQYSFNFDEKICYIDGLFYGKILSHSDTIIEVELQTQPEPIIQEFRLYVPDENNKENI